ncbi:MAG: alpha/beta hydrolase family esterase [Elstera sp.]
MTLHTRGAVRRRKATLRLQRTAAIVVPRTLTAGRVTEIAAFGSNPGDLRMLVYEPERRLPANAPLIVVLHGCGQEAAAFAAQTGWVALADKLGAALLLPEQKQTNSRGRCFNWYQLGDVRRGRGEALSIRQMISAATKRYHSDRRRVFIVGLSAGGAMAGAMMAAYPSVFRAGAIVAGMPVGAAQSLTMAMLRMQQAEPFKGRASLADAVRRSAPAHIVHAWPRVSIWHGSDDRVIDPANATLLAAQWSEVHGLAESDGVAETPFVVPGIQRRTWGTARRTAVELWTIDGMGHGFPIDPQHEDGTETAFAVVDAGVAATHEIARFWGLTP